MKILVLNGAYRPDGTTTELRRREVLDFLAFVESQGEDDLGPEWDAELQARLRDVEEGRASGRPVAEVVREMRAKYG